MTDDLLTKEQIARELAPKDAKPLSVRSVERYINLAEVSPAELGSGRGNQSKFRRVDVEKIKAAYKIATTKREKKTTSLAIVKPATRTHDALLDLRLQQGISTLNQNGKERPLAHISVKLMLTVAEAAALSNLSEDFLMKAIKAGKLIGKVIGRSYKIKRPDLDAYIKKL
jgi:excisionase family DNA binding protein